MERAKFRSQIHLGLAGMLVMLAGTQAAYAQDDAEGDDRGLTEYEISCMPCHGVDGRGNGPQAADLSKAPADLTRIAAGNGGVFPESQVRDMIDGRADVAAHGIRDMPIWGERYRIGADADDSAKDVDRRARELIGFLVNYLKFIQER